jgi:hypothetical protein
MLFQTIFDEWGEQIKQAWMNADPIEIWGWILVVFGITFVALLIIFSEYKRPERDSVKFSAIIVVLASICLGFGLHLVWTASGYW